MQLIIIMVVSSFPQLFLVFHFRRPLLSCCWANTSRFVSTFRDSKSEVGLCTQFCRFPWLCCSRSLYLCWTIAGHLRLTAILFCNWCQGWSLIFACLRSIPQSSRCIYLFAYRQCTSPWSLAWVMIRWPSKDLHSVCFPFRILSWRPRVQLGNEYSHCILTLRGRCSRRLPVARN